MPHPVEAFELEKEIRLLKTFIILHDLWSYVLDLMFWLHHSCISVQTQAFGPSYVNHVVLKCDLVVNSITRPICFPVANYMFYVVKHKLGENLHKSCSLVVRFVSQVVLYYRMHLTFQ